jgi:hypothetical protein
MTEFTKILREAEGWWDLGLPQDTWETLESLPYDACIAPGAIRMRLLACIAMGRWDLGGPVFDLVSLEYGLGVLESAGLFLIGRGASFCASGNITAARDGMTTLAGLWPEGLPVAVDCKALTLSW